MSTHSIHKILTIPFEFHGERLDSALAQMLPEFSRSQLSHWIKSDFIQVNQHPCKPKDKALAGDVIEIRAHFVPENTLFTHCQPEEIPLNIIYEDDELLIINKPAGLVVHPGAGNKEHTLMNALLFHSSTQHHLPRAGIIHRLDKDTTGLLMIAKSFESHTALIRQMQAREIHRQYVTLVQGQVISGGTIDTGFGRHPTHRLKMTVLEQGRQAVTHYSIKKRYNEFTLLDVNLMTGRTHQIRVHMAYIKHPVVGDPLYGGRMKYPPHANQDLITLFQQFKRQALHAHSLTFFHPKTGKELTFIAPMPDDFKILLDTLDQHNEL